MKHALIVDDSRVARAVLRKTLVGFGVDVDEVPTAEAAIEYLKVDSPDIIFLDHLMPGMDGFDALSALKANPSTATIPVLMYTTQEGKLYASQARALGAVDVLPKSLAPADVERILRSHHLIGEPRRTTINREEPGNAERDDLIERFRAIVDDRVGMLMSDFRYELARSQSASEAHLRQVIEEFKPMAMPTPVRQPSNRFGIAASVAALAIVAAVAIPILPNQESTSEVLEPPRSITQDTSLSAAVAEAEAALEAEATHSRLVTAEPDPIAQSERAAMADAIARAWNTTEPYPYGAVPLDDERARDFAQLLSQLKSEGFSGTVTFDIYEGRHCINYRADGFTELAPPSQPVTACDYIGTPTPVTALQSPMFENMVASVTRDGEITVVAVAHGTSDPIIDYPALDYSLTAAEWNSIAAINQRVAMRIRAGDTDNLSRPVAYLSN